MFHHQSFHPNSNMYTHTLYKISVFVICLSLQQFQFAIGEDCSEERTTDAAMESMGCKRPSQENAADASKASEINKKLGNVRGRAKCAASRSDSQRLSSAEKKRRQKFLDKLQCLRNMVPSGNKEKKSRTDELDDTILYLKYLENQYLYFQLMLAEPGSPNPSNLVTKPKKFIANKKSGAFSSNQCVRSKCKFCPSSATDNRAVTICFSSRSWGIFNLCVDYPSRTIPSWPVVICIVTHHI
ncbi:uncharacterized protein LOC112096837 isoform X2 [Citrus clementina]|uniref:uncharacterized protein LOC112096837 isoform X2 n=1 Tax=Citrus clementina TaxID=85681 RepID=UPI000CED0709|nr:uncharacterized protein LOC112096837 isoform X2 [Citrus x clementina]